MKTYELLEKQVAAMKLAEQYGIEDWRNLVQCRRKLGLGMWVPVTQRFLQEDDLEYRFAIAIVAGKPVFVGDELYVRDAVVQVIGVNARYDDILDHTNGSTDVKRLSWNPPAPKTVMVELVLEDIQFLAKISRDFSTPGWGRISRACKAILDKEGML